MKANVVNHKLQSNLFRQKLKQKAKHNVFQHLPGGHGHHRSTSGLANPAQERRAEVGAEDEAMGEPKHRLEVGDFQSRQPLRHTGHPLGARAATQHEMNSDILLSCEAPGAGVSTQHASLDKQTLEHPPSDLLTKIVTQEENLQLPT